MDVSGSPDRVFDFPDGETPWTYGGFAPGPPLGYTGNPSGSGGWLEADDLPIHAMRTTAASKPVIKVLLDDSDMDDSAMHVDPVLAPVVPSPLMTTPPPLVVIPELSVHEVGESSTAADVRLPSTVEKLDTLMDDVEIRQDVLVTRMDTVRDAVTAIGAVVGEIGLRVIALEGHTQETLIHMVQDQDAQIEQLSAEMVSVLEREYGLMQMIATMSKCLADVKKRIHGPP
ncbi:hypothetical protein Tco_1249753 [Tanacetum coccineum]